MSLGEWLDKWLDEYMIFTLRESTMQSYRMIVNHYIKPHLGKKPLTSLTTADIQKLYNKLKKEGRVREDPIKGKTLADSMVRGIHMMLHEALDAAVKERLIVRNPTNGTTVPKPNYPDKQVLDDGQLEKFLGMIEAYPDWRDFFYTECMTGLRRGEICGLKWSDIDFEKKKIKVCKQLLYQDKQWCFAPLKTVNSYRSVNITAEFAQYLADMKMQHDAERKLYGDGYKRNFVTDRREPKKEKIIEVPDFINVKANGEMLTTNGAKFLARIIKKDLGIHFKFHNLRHTYATVLAENGLNPRYVQEMLGHSKLEFTLRYYTHITEKMSDAAENALTAAFRFD